MNKGRALSRLQGGGGGVSWGGRVRKGRELSRWHGEKGRELRRQGEEGA